MVSELKEQNGLLKTEKDDLNRLIQEQSQQMTGVQTAALKVTHSLSLSKSTETNLASAFATAEKMARSIVQETQQLNKELNEERSRYQNLLSEHRRLEEKYDDLKEHLASSVSDALDHQTSVCTFTPLCIMYPDS